MNLPIPLWRAQLKKNPLEEMPELFNHALSQSFLHFISFHSIHFPRKKPVSIPQDIPGYSWRRQRRLPDDLPGSFRVRAACEAFSCSTISLLDQEKGSRDEKMLIDSRNMWKQIPYICFPPPMRTIGQYRAARPQYTTA